jgi:hypothetical protein
MYFIGISAGGRFGALLSVGIAEAILGEILSF